MDVERNDALKLIDKRVMLTGDHPSSGQVGVVLGIEKHQGVGWGLNVLLDDTRTVAAFPGQWRLAGSR